MKKGSQAEGREQHLTGIAKRFPLINARAVIVKRRNTIGRAYSITFAKPLR